MGRTNERLARLQESYVGQATSTWLESLERSLAQMKEYQAARKKLENRRLAYDASLSKMQKAKKEDFRVEEELRAQKAKYEESSEDVYRCSSRGTGPPRGCSSLQRLSSGTDSAQTQLDGRARRAT